MKFEPSILGVFTLMIAWVESINSGLQMILLIATIVYTIFRILEIINKK
jgi:hypothetical protein